jgi:hypothetical protein
MTQIFPNDPWPNKNKKKAHKLLLKTDFAVLPDVNIHNRQEFIDFRLAVRQIYLNPPENGTQIDWPQKPDPDWM